MSEQPTDDRPGFANLRSVLMPSVAVPPCRLLMSGLQVARVIGKKGILIKELREESGAVINVLDDQLPVAFANRDERVMFVRGTLEQQRTAIAGILRYAIGGVASMSRGDEDEHQRSCEIMVPEASCAHLIGERGSRINALMEETKCDLHLVREPVSGLSDQKRLRITGPSLRDTEFAVAKMQEFLHDLVRFGTLTEDSFSMKEGPTAAADLIPRERGRGTGVAVAILLPKDDVAWVIGKRGSKISKLRERARVNVNDALLPSSGNRQEVILDITAAPLREELHVLSLIVDDLAIRPETNDVTKLLVPAEQYREVVGIDGGNLLRIAEQSRARVCEIPPDKAAVQSSVWRVLEITGAERDRVAAATAVYEAVEQLIAPETASGGSSQTPVTVPYTMRQTEQGRVSTEPRPPTHERSSASTASAFVSAPTASSAEKQGPARVNSVAEPLAAVVDSPATVTPAAAHASSDQYRKTAVVVDELPRNSRSPAEPGLPSPLRSSPVAATEEAIGAAAVPVLAAPGLSTSRTQWSTCPAAMDSPATEASAPVAPAVRGGTQTGAPLSEASVGDTGTRSVVAREFPPVAPKTIGVLVAGEGPAIASAANDTDAVDTIPTRASITAPAASTTEIATFFDTAATEEQRNPPAGNINSEKPGEFTLSVFVPTMDVARYLVGSSIAARTGARMSANIGDGGQPLLRLVGTPTANAATCYFVQEALCTCGIYAAQNFHGGGVATRVGM
eukprot:TRINITY_DN74374_c0_g1_i1.p1 TRINITY_DN74374_c0_g1~~TRINITY_DN74374_c0_g1_i1.p1  ORF type:complete len:736 (-),score=119.25 TRINITY_DN74374_c0_g1_i1:114-2321(-)